MAHLSMLLHYSLLALFFWACMKIYLKIAMRYGIFDRPNRRSSHNYIAIRGGGVLFLMAAIAQSLEHLERPGRLQDRKSVV